MAEEITTERLFELTADGFESVHTQMDAGINAVLGELQALKETSRQILSAVEALLEKKLEEHDRRLKRLEKHAGIES